MRANDNNNPFVGPIPCSELDAKNFYGRNNELRDLLQKVRTQALTIITAESGAGKTSLIRAALIPALRHRRDGNTDSMGFALYVGIWGIAAKKSEDKDAGFSLSHPAHIFRDALQKGFYELKDCADKNHDLVGIKQLEEDLNGLSAVFKHYKEIGEPTDQDESAALLEQLVSDIKSVVPGNKLILIVDQAEEFMGSGVGAGRDFLTGALYTLASLLQTEGVKVIISLREEYMGKLRLLEEMYMPLAPRLFHLYPLTWDNAHQALRKVASSSECVKIGNEEISKILGWANSSSSAQSLDRSSSTVDMLAAQAFLSDIYDREYSLMKAKAVNNGVVHMTIDDECLERYEKQMFKEEPQFKERQNDLYIGALLRWIDKVFNEYDVVRSLVEYVTEDKGTDSEQDDRKASAPQLISTKQDDRKVCVSLIVEHIIAGKPLIVDTPNIRWVEEATNEVKRLAVSGPFVKRIAANMGTVLATPRGFKSHISKGNLIFHAIRKELAMWSNEQDRDKDKVSPKINDARKELEKNNKLSESNGYKGLAVRLGAAGSVAVDLLVKSNILKSCGSDEHGSMILSLQHDGYAPALTEWCNDMKRREDDVLVPGVGVYGMQIVRSKAIETPELDDLRWEGCFVDDVVIKGVTFKNCSFNACFMTRCKFYKCTFHDCKINGAFFMGGEFADVKFIDCSLLGAVMTEMNWKNVNITNCNLSSSVVKNVILSNTLKIENSTAHFAQLHKFNHAKRDNAFDITAIEFDVLGALFEDFNEKDKEHFDCKNTTEYTKNALRKSKD